MGHRPLARAAPCWPRGSAGPLAQRAKYLRWDGLIEGDLGHLDRRELFAVHYDRYKQQHATLAINHQLEVVDGPFENAACHPIWSQDGKHIAFGSDSRVLWSVETQTLNVEFVKFANSPPWSLLDVSDLIA